MFEIEFTMAFFDEILSLKVHKQLSDLQKTSFLNLSGKAMRGK